MNNENSGQGQKSIFEHDISPFRQMVVILALMIVVELLIFLFNHNSSSPILIRNYYTTALVFVFLYSIFNPILSLSTLDQNKYWMHSIISFVVICIVGISLAYLLSGQSIDEAGPFRWMYIVFSFGYLIFLGILRAMKKIVLLAQKQDKRLRGED
jgi:hypothetical protein